MRSGARGAPASRREVLDQGCGGEDPGYLWPLSRVTEVSAHVGQRNKRHRTQWSSDDPTLVEAKTSEGLDRRSGHPSVALVAQVLKNNQLQPINCVKYQVFGRNDDQGPSEGTAFYADESSAYLDVP